MSTMLLRNVSLPANKPFEGCNRNSTLLVHKVYFWCLVGFIPLTVVGNALVCVVVLGTRKLRHQPLYIFLTSLAVADVFVGVVVMPLKSKVEWDDGCFCLPSFLCWALRLAEIVFFIASTLHLLVISIDRYFAVKYTHEYKMLMCRKTHLLVLLCVWVFSIVWSILSIFQWDMYYDFSVQRGANGCKIVNRNYFTTTYIVLFVVPVCFMSLLYVYIYRKVRVREGRRPHIEFSDTSSLVETYNKKKECVALHSITIVFVTYAICWVPYVFLTLAISSDMNPRHDERSFPVIKFVVADFLPSVESTLNPIIYVVFNKSILCSAKKLLGKIQRNKWASMYADMKRKRHTMPAYIADILYNEEEDNCFELEVVPHDSPPQRRFTM